VIHKIRDLLNTPFARPPGRRGLWARFAPEWCALTIYLVVGCIVVLYGLRRYSLDHDEFWPVMSTALQVSAGVAYGMFAICITVFPLVSAALTFASERSRGTFEAMILTPLDGRRIAAMRWLHVVAPWLRLFVWMLPVYGMIAGSAIAEEVTRHCRFRWDDVAGCFALALVPKGFMAFLVAIVGVHEDMKWSLGGCALAAGRFFGDLCVFAVLTGGAYLCSVRFSTTVRALLGAFLLVLGGLVTVLTFDGLGALGLVLFQELRAFSYSQHIPAIYYVLAAPLATLARLALGALMTLLAVLLFNAWAVRETKAQG